MQDKIARMIRKSGIFDRIIKRKRHYGLDRNIKEGISEIFKIYDAVIVIEDDLILDSIALTYLRIQLLKYKDDPKIGQVNLQGNFIHSHGWATWKDRWQNIDWGLVPLSGHLSKAYLKHPEAWDIIFHHNLDRNGWTAIGKKLATHIGNIGTHYNILSRFGIRKHFRKWREDYYRDKDVIMVKENLLTRFYMLYENIQK